jgi:hypothetical protein
VPDVDEARLGPKDAQVAAGIYYSALRTACDKCFNGAIDREALRDPAEIDSHAPAKKGPAVFARRDVSPGGVHIRVAPRRREIVSSYEQRRNRNIKCAIALARELTGRPQDLPGPWMDGYVLGKGIAIQA